MVHHCTHCDGINILKIKAGVSTKIFIANITAPQHRSHTIDKKDFIVHTIVKSRFLKGVVRHFGGTPIADRIKQTNLHIGV